MWQKKVNIIDSAGIRSPQNIIEAKGIDKTIQNIDKIENFILVLSQIHSIRTTLLILVKS